MRNLESKVGCDVADFTDIFARVEQLGGEPFYQLKHKDTYFRADRGRLKLREINGDLGAWTELIGYRRENVPGSRWSDYHRIELEPDEAVAVKRALELTCGILTIIDKLRWVSTWSRSRIHLDAVAQLGSFVEVETVAGSEDDDADILTEHKTVHEALALGRFQAVASSYSDLLLAFHGEETA